MPIPVSNATFTGSPVLSMLSSPAFNDDVTSVVFLEWEVDAEDVGARLDDVQDGVDVVLFHFLVGFGQVALADEQIDGN